MKNRSIFLFFLCLTLLFCSCAKESFVPSSISLRRYIEYDEDDVKREHLIFQFSSSKGDKKYTFRILSPDGDLSWEGMLYKNGTLLVSDPLLITPSSAFPEGIYKYNIYSEMGSVVSGEISLPWEEETHVNYEDASDASTYTIKLLNKEGIRIYEERDAEIVEIDYRDKYRNFVIVKERFPH